MKHILLVNPNFNPLPADEAQPHRAPRSVAASWSPFQMVMAPLGLATVAALTPDEYAVDIWDEAMDGPIGPGAKLRRDYDLVGVTGYINHAGRVNELGRFFREQGVLTAVGGPGVSSEPELYRDSFDVLFLGEAEYTWPRFLVDWAAGRSQDTYRQVGKVDVADTPLPRWERVALAKYMMGAVQTTRGCPFDCEFCDVIYLFGRQARHKTVERVLGEVTALERRGVRRVLFCDDNFIGNKRYAKELVRALIELNRGFRRPVAFFAQLTLDVAKDDELLALMADANFPGVFIGLESPNRASLVETNKPQNYKTDMVADLKKLHSYGLIVQGGLIVGFDHDDATIFDQHFELIQATGLAVPMINVLKAPKGTRLWTRLLGAGRVFQSPELRHTLNVESLTNVIPAQMTLSELWSGYLRLVERVREWRNFEARLKTLIGQVRRRPRVRARGYWKETLLFPVLLAMMDREARGATLRLLVHVLRRAPFMVESVMGAVAYQYQEALRVPGLRRLVGEQLRLLAEGKRTLEREPAVFFVPPDFRRAFKVVFPELYERVKAGLVDPDRAQEVLVQVAYDFLTRWGPSFASFEGHHQVFLNELCDRAVAGENRKPPAASPPQARAVRLHGLSDEVLRCVEQDLRRLQPASAGAARPG